MFVPVKKVKLTVTAQEERLVVAGFDTFSVKEAIKGLGGSWDPTTKVWKLLLNTDIAPLQQAANELGITRLAEANALKEKKAYLRTPEGQKSLVLDALATGCHWICCDQCKVIDWVRQHSSCEAHAEYGNSFRVRGFIYTGD